MANRSLSKVIRFLPVDGFDDRPVARFARWSSPWVSPPGRTIILFTICVGMGRTIMTAEMNRSTKLADTIEQIAKAFKSANIGQGQKVGYREDSSEERLQATAEHEGVKLYRNPDGSHHAVDESHSSYER